MDFSTPLRYLKGVGKQRAEVLQNKGLFTVGDLLLYAPFRYEDRSNVKMIAELAPGEMATVIARVHSSRYETLRRKPGGIYVVAFRDEFGKFLLGKWFQGEYLSRVFEPGIPVALYGKVELDPFTGELVMLHPEYELLGDDSSEPDTNLHLGRIVPIYEAAGRINTRVFRTLVYRALQNVEPPPDWLPESIRKKLDLPDYWTAIQELHFPSPGQELQLLNAFRTPAQYRLIFEEFFWLECGLTLRKKQLQRARGIEFKLSDHIRKRIVQMLPFKPTPAQKRALAEIARDMASPHPMNRLLQGDVGSGKTLVAAEAAVIAIENGYQVAFLAPTEILATQHFLYLTRLFEPLDYKVELLIGSTPGSEKARIKEALASGQIQLVVGTHALLEEDVKFARLGLAIIDEQHRFGVIQRLRLIEKSQAPDVLVMTATPIPRTLALTLYGDLDVSLIDQLPPGRKPVVTKHLPESQIELVWSFVRQQVLEGRQAYVVYPVIEESEDGSLQAAEQGFQHLSQRVFPDLKVGLLHGRLPRDQKEETMRRFQSGDIQILVCTTVIEVGVDVPNASVMVIQQAERFGLAQLHQLRGRVGRGPWQSYCILVTRTLSDTARERIRTLVESNDGFYIAEMDLKLRGPGEFFGTRQAGMPTFRLAQLLRDSEILETARREALEFIDNPPSRAELEKVQKFLAEHWTNRYFLALVG